MSDKILRQLIREHLKSMMETVEDVGGRPRKNPRARFVKFIEDWGGSDETAEKFDISVSHLNKIARGAAVPSFKLLKKIMNATNGYIDANYFKEE